MHWHTLGQTRARPPRWIAYLCLRIRCLHRPGGLLLINARLPCTVSTRRARPAGLPIFHHSPRDSANQRIELCLRAAQRANLEAETSRVSRSGGHKSGSSIWPSLCKTLASRPANPNNLTAKRKMIPQHASNSSWNKTLPNGLE